jgi:hypothetical protein
MKKEAYSSVIGRPGKCNEGWGGLTIGIDGVVL